MYKKMYVILIFVFATERALKQKCITINWFDNINVFFKYTLFLPLNLIEIVFDLPKVGEKLGCARFHILTPTPPPPWIHY